MSLSLRDEESEKNMYPDDDSDYRLYTHHNKAPRRRPASWHYPPRHPTLSLSSSASSRAFDRHVNRVPECQMPPPSALTTTDSLDIPCALQQRRPSDAYQKDSQTSSNIKDLCEQ
jgi:hypothetical protein